MATVQKSSKINFYKFVQVKEPSGSVSGNKDQVALTSAINSNVKATNNLGSTLNSIANILTDFKKIQLAQLEIDQKSRPKFQAEYTKTKKSSSPIMETMGGAAKKAGSWLDGLLKMVGSFLKAAIIIPALEWLADEENQKKVETAINIIGDIAKFIFDVSKFAVTNTIEGLYDLLKDDATWQERLLGLGKAVVGIGTIVLGVRYLKNPTKIITDISRGIRALINFVTGGGRRGGNLPTGSKRRRFSGAARFLLGTGVAVGTGYAINQSMNQPEPEGKAQGGPIKKASQGGWISGPQSGYKVSLDGGRSTSFIGHGTEYVARKSNGGAFVVPFNTPGTKTQPHLTQKRISEARSQGYQLPGFSQGGLVGGISGNPPNPKQRKIFLHWSGGTHSGIHGLPYHQTFDGSGRPASKNVNYGIDKYAHTAGHNTNAVGLGAAAMGHGAPTKPYSDARGWAENPLTNAQTTAMAKEAAALLKAYGQKPSDVDRNVWTHGEWERYAVKSGKLPPPVQRWDLDSLTPGPYNHPGGFFTTQQIRSQGGKQMRAKIKSFMTGAKGEPSVTNPDESGGRSVMSNFLGAIDAITGNRTDFDGMGTGNAGAASPAPPTPKREIGKADPGVKVEPLPANFSDKQAFMHIYNIARKVGGTKWPEIVAAQAMHETGYLKAKPSVYFATGKTNPFGQTGDRGYGTIPRAGDPAGWTKYPNLEEAVRDHIKLWHNTGNHPQNYNAHDTILDGIAAVAPAYSPNSDPANIRLGYTTDGYSKGMVRALKIGGFDPKTKRTGAAPAATASSSSSLSSSSSSSGSSRSGSSDSAPARLLKRFGFEPREGGFLDTGTYTTQPGAVDGGERNRLQRQTDSRNAARRQINERTQQMVQTAMTAIAQQNGVNSQAIAAAQQSIQMVMSQPQPQPALAGGGGAAPKPSTASSLNSFINPLKNIFK